MIEPKITPQNVKKKSNSKYKRRHGWKNLKSGLKRIVIAVLETLQASQFSKFIFVVS